MKSRIGSSSHLQEETQQQAGTAKAEVGSGGYVVVLILSSLAVLPQYLIFEYAGVAYYVALFTWHNLQHDV
jgi:hypothetical protein